jgi:hypothetical protein
VILIYLFVWFIFNSCPLNLYDELIFSPSHCWNQSDLPYHQDRARSAYTPLLSDMALLLVTQEMHLNLLNELQTLLSMYVGSFIIVLLNNDIKVENFPLHDKIK